MKRYRKKPVVIEAMQYLPHDNCDEIAQFIYGDSDFLTSAADHERLAAVVNAAHPGNATLQIIEDLDHYVVRTESEASSFARVSSGSALGPYDERFSQTIGDWICARARCTAG